ncbi:MAG: symmetrical bis(5'-nucleosyl)-tetraphosphatase [Rhodocyclaceae bacterium]|nr:symmetrical bis(5'-nucleosyl)-tetraphosphatase [Rhodocyclaceae bacterium]
MATYAIGDVQGCLTPLLQLLETVGFDSRRDRLWFVGDLVNRGPDSLGVLRFVKALGDAAVVTLGNHDLSLIMRAEGFGKESEEDTIAPVLCAPDREALIDWLCHQPLFHCEGEWAMVHAGLLPSWSVSRARALAQEVEAALRGAKRREFLAHLWGSEPTAWRDDLEGWDRLRVIVNAMTRMRFIWPDGRMEFRAAGAKGPPSRGPAGTMPWFSAPNRASADHVIVCGHWSALGYFELPNLVALDSGCLWGGQLTALRLEDRRVFQAPCGRMAMPSGWQ